MGAHPPNHPARQIRTMTCRDQRNVSTFNPMTLLFYAGASSCTGRQMPAGPV